MQRKRKTFVYAKNELKVVSIDVCRKDGLARRETPVTLSPWCRVLLEKLTGLQLVKKFPTFYGTRRFITALTSVRHLSLSWVSPIQSIHPHPTTWRSNTPHRRSVWGSSLPPDCFVSRASIPQAFCNVSILQGGVVSTSPNPHTSWKTTPRRLSETAYSIYSQLPSLSEAVPLSAT